MTFMIDKEIGEISMPREVEHELKVCLYSGRMQGSLRDFNERRSGEVRLSVAGHIGPWIRLRLAILSLDDIDFQLTRRVSITAQVTSTIIVPRKSFCRLCLCLDANFFFLLEIPTTQVFFFLDTPGLYLSNM